MIERMKYLHLFLLAMILCVLLNLMALLLFGLQSGDLVWSTIVDALYVEVVFGTGMFYVLQHGHYPTVAEVLTWPWFEIGLILLCWWSVSAGLLVVIGRASQYVWRTSSHRFKRWAISLLLMASIAWLCSYVLPTPSIAHIHIRANTTLGPTSAHQFGFSQGGEIEMQTAGYFEGALKRLAPLHPRYIRIDHIFDYYHVYQKDASGQIRYEWTELDRVVDAIVASGAQPMLCLSYLPPALARRSVYGPPSDWVAWETLVYQTVYHLNVERRLGIRYWEVWNEPNLPNFWDGTLDEYLQLYAVTTRGALRADASVRLGGPTTAFSPTDLKLEGQFSEKTWITALARYVQAQRLPLDFLSWHYYDPQPSHYVKSVQLHQQWLAEQGMNVPLWLTEWNRSGPPSPSLDTEETAAHAAAVIATLAETPLTQALFFEVIDNSKQWEGRWGLMRADGKLKPVFNTFRLANELRSERLASQSDHPNVYALAARNGSTLSVLIAHLATGRAALPVTLSITGLSPQAILKIGVYGVDATHDNTDRAVVDETLLLETKVERVTEQGEWRLELTIPDNGVRLIQLQIQSD
jgi:xylan 1,4-beta-xylosidase